MLLGLALAPLTEQQQDDAENAEEEQQQQQQPIALATSTKAPPTATASPSKKSDDMSVDFATKKVCAPLLLPCPRAASCLCRPQKLPQKAKMRLRPWPRRRSMLRGSKLMPPGTTAR